MFSNQPRFFKLAALTLILVISIFYFSTPAYSYNTSSSFTEQVKENETHAEGTTKEHANSEHQFAAGWSVIPFVLLLAMIATGPLFFEHFWHHNYPKVAVFLASVVVLYYVFGI
ncbi:hypothetical protein MNBD_BACTEROID06-1015, partial [hydrothermal vent metagenome]